MHPTQKFVVARSLETYDQCVNSKIAVVIVGIVTDGGAYGCGVQVRDHFAHRRPNRLAQAHPDNASPREAIVQCDHDTFIGRAGPATTEIAVAGEQPGNEREVRPPSSDRRSERLESIHAVHPPHRTIEVPRLSRTLAAAAHRPIHHEEWSSLPAVPNREASLSSLGPGVPELQPQCQLPFHASFSSKSVRLIGVETEARVDDFARMSAGPRPLRPRRLNPPRHLRRKLLCNPASAAPSDPSGSSLSSRCPVSLPNPEVSNHWNYLLQVHPRRRPVIRVLALRLQRAPA